MYNQHTPKLCLQLVISSEDIENIMLRLSWFSNHWTRLDKFNNTVATCNEEHTPIHSIVSFRNDHFRAVIQYSIYVYKGEGKTLLRQQRQSGLKGLEISLQKGGKWVSSSQ